MTIVWYCGPTWWSPKPDHLWHRDCRDLVRAGHDGEVFVWPDGCVTCTGCGQQCTVSPDKAPVTAVVLL